ncbi:hypothetical protein [Brachyspira sp. G79]|uniref:hypothetical protein n=1 Tax=Brachyspira sp. G79 TaxID=1358104 RepID=UPI000BBC6A59|nr:hypothetical protein [Brachyspira sp. G79]
MIKKLFLFTLLVSSFLVISCNNKDKTGTGASPEIETYAGTYNGNMSYTVDPSQNFQTTLTVNADGSVVLNISSIFDTPLTISKSELQNNGGGKYTCSGTDAGFTGTITFQFNGSSVVISIDISDSSSAEMQMTGTLTKQTTAQQ